MGAKSSGRRRLPGSDHAGSDPSQAESARLSRRKVFTGAIGAAALGATGGSVLAGAVASPALAATGAALAAQATTIEPGAVVPAVVALTDAPTIAVDASLGDDFRVTLGGNRTMGAPSNSSNGQQIIFQVTQGNGGPFTLAWESAYEFSDGLPQPTLSATPGKTDLLGFIYNTAKGKWLLAAFVNGFG